MAGITLAHAQAQLDAWLAASLAVATKQEYRIGDRTLTHADAAEVRKTVQYWDQWVKQLSRTQGRTKYVVPE